MGQGPIIATPEWVAPGDIITVNFYEVPGLSQSDCYPSINIIRVRQFFIRVR